MKRLYLLRHAKSDWSDAKRDDHSRPLTPRGVRAARAMAEWLGACVPAPDLILCSTARRAAETCRILLQDGRWRAPAIFEDGLYLCGADALAERLRAVPDEIGAVLLVGHNPDLENLADRIVVDGPPGDVARMREKFPTAAFAWIDLKIASWRDMGAARGRLARFVRPKDLERLTAA